MSRQRPTDSASFHSHLSIFKPFADLVVEEIGATKVQAKREHLTSCRNELPVRVDELDVLIPSLFLGVDAKMLRVHRDIRGPIGVLCRHV